MSSEGDASRRRVVALLGVALGLLGLAALASIPRGLHEFFYDVPNSISSLPFGPLNGLLPALASSLLARALFLGPGLLLLSWAWRPDVSRMAAALRAAQTPRVLLGLHLLVVLGVMVFVVQGVPLQDDEATYLMQADLLRHGRIVDETTPPAAQFLEPFTIFTPRGITGKYLFGEPLLLALGQLVGFPLLAHLGLAALGAWVWHLYHTRHGGGDAYGRLALLLWVLSPAILFTTATPVSQVPSLVLSVVAVWAATRGGLRWGALAGCCVGFVTVCRPQCAVPLGIVVGGMGLRRGGRAVAGMALGGLPWLVALLVYNSYVTGSPLKLPWEMFSVERFGFGRPFHRPGVPELDSLAAEYVHTPLKGVYIALVVLVRLNGWALGWPVSLVGVAAWLAAGRPQREAVTPWAALALTTFAFQFLYYSAGTHETGAGYHYLALPFLLSATAATLAQTGWRHVALARRFALLCTLLGTSTFALEHAYRLRRLSDAIDMGFNRVTVRAPALVFHETSLSGSLQFGWVLGISQRPRGAWHPVLHFPRGDEHSVRALQAAWPHRACVYTYRRPPDMAVRQVPCGEMWPIAAEIGAELKTGFPYPQHEGDGPLYGGDRWRRDFPWLGWFGLSGFGEPWRPGL